MINLIKKEHLNSVWLVYVFTGNNEKFVEILLIAILKTW